PVILVVDRDGSSWAPDSFTDVWPIFEEALIDNDYDYEYWEVINAEDNGPDFVYMGDFDMVIWFTGEVWAGSATLTFDDEINLILYLADGGNLFLSAQDYLWDVYPTAGTFEEGQFPYDYLGLREVVQDVWNIDMPDLGSVDGVAGSLAEGMEIEFQDLFTTAREGLFIDEITDHVGQDMFLLWDPAPEGICGVQYETDVFSTVFTTASYACIVDYDARMELLVNIVDFLTGTGVGINDRITSAEITMFPNPAYDMVEVTSLKIIKEVTIYNNIGQMVLNQVSDNNRVVINTSNYQTGIYTVQIKTENGITTEKLLIN
ncbi:MAG: T9SS type A sorting domain-containing protein, partial [Bacteroidales bacterium]|nr:T9SS type A sorting domain-containing protein [Bacteroidales bacterium]